MKTSLAAGAMLLALVAAEPAASASSCAASASDWGPFKPLAHSQAQLASKGTLTIVALGSSSTSGTGATSRDRSYPSQLAAILQQRFPDAQIEVINAGVHGDTVAMNLARLDRDVLARQPDLVIWQVGTNDALQKKNLTQVHGAILGGIARMKQVGADVVLMDAQFFPDRPDTEMLKASRAMVRKAAAEAQVGFLPRNALMRHWIANGDFTASTMIVADKIHMSNASYHCLAERVADLLPVPATSGGGVVAVATSKEAPVDKTIIAH